MKQRIKELFSTQRLSRYCLPGQSDVDAQCFINYLSGVKRAESLYFALHLIEVTLRNAIYYAYKKHHASQDFFYLHHTHIRDKYLKRKEFHSRECWKMLCGARAALVRRNEPIHEGKLIAELNFGFWTKLMEGKHQNYDTMWRKIFFDVFSYHPQRNASVSIHRLKQDVWQKFERIRKLRNRVFHYEPIAPLAPDERYREIEEILGWIDNDLPSLLRLSEYETHRWQEPYIAKILKLSKWRWRRQQVCFKRFFGSKRRGL